MIRALALCLPLLAACAGPMEHVAFAPCPPRALPVCHAGGSGCETAPFCYRTLGVVDCYPSPEPARRTVEEIVAPAACPAFLRAG